MRYSAISSHTQHFHTHTHTSTHTSTAHSYYFPLRVSSAIIEARSARCSQCSHCMSHALLTPQFYCCAVSPQTVSVWLRKREQTFVCVPYQSDLLKAHLSSCGCQHRISCMADAACWTGVSLPLQNDRTIAGWFTAACTPELLVLSSVWTRPISPAYPRYYGRQACRSSRHSHGIREAEREASTVPQAQSSTRQINAVQGERRDYRFRPQPNKLL